MKKKFIYIVVFIFTFIGCSNTKQKKIKLGKNSQINYIFDKDRITYIEVVQNNQKAILYYPQKDEIEFSITDNGKNCQAILTNDFYSLEVSNGADNDCRINKNENITSLDFAVNDEYQTIIEYDVKNKNSENCQRFGDKEYLFVMDENEMKLK